MFSWRSPVAACGSLRSRKFPSELSGSLTNPHTHQPLLPPSEPCPRYLPAQPPTPVLAPSSALAASPSCCFVVVVVPCVSPVHCFYVLDAHVRRQQWRRRRLRQRRRQRVRQQVSWLCLVANVNATRGQLFSGPKKYAFLLPIRISWSRFDLDLCDPQPPTPPSYFLKGIPRRA